MCAAPAATHASTTAGLSSGVATPIRLPVCALHIATARSEPTVLAFLAKTFSLSLDLPALIRSKSIPHAMIPTVHQIAASELGGTVGSVEQHDGVWVLKIDLSEGRHWMLQLSSLMNYAYLLFHPGSEVEVYRLDSAPPHSGEPFFPLDLYAQPINRKDARIPSFLSGLPLFDLKRLRAIGDERWCIEVATGADRPVVNS